MTHTTWTHATEPAGDALAELEHDDALERQQADDAYAPVSRAMTRQTCPMPAWRARQVYPLTMGVAPRWNVGKELSR